MGREAECLCKIGGKQAVAKVLLEQKELIIRGEFKRKIAISAMKNVHVDGDRLCFSTDDNTVSLALGPQTAQKWIGAIQKPPATLAHKLGIRNDTVIRLVGKVSSDELKTALAEGNVTNAESPQVIVACVENRKDCLDAWESVGKWTEAEIPLWVIFRKGAKAEFGETAVREMLRGLGLRDTKVAAVSATQTALRFVRANSRAKSGAVVD